MSLCVWSNRNQKLVRFPRAALDLVSTIRWISNTEFVVDGANALLPGELPRTVYPVVAETMTTPVVYRTKENRVADPRPDKYEVPPVSPGIVTPHGPRTIYAANLSGGLRVLTTIENTPTGDAHIDGVPNSPYLSIAETSAKFSQVTMRSTNGAVRIIDVRNGDTVRTFTKLLQNRAQIASSLDGTSVAWCAQTAKARSLEIFMAGIKDDSVRIVSRIPTTSPPPIGRYRLERRRNADIYASTGSWREITFCEKRTLGNQRCNGTIATALFKHQRAHCESRSQSRRIHRLLGRPLTPTQLSSLHRTSQISNTPSFVSTSGQERRKRCFPKTPCTMVSAETSRERICTSFAKKLISLQTSTRSIRQPTRRPGPLRT